MATSNHSIFELNPNNEQLTIGIIYSTVALSVFPIYIPIIYTIRVTKDLNENISYKLINSMNIFDLMQSFGHFSTGIFIIFPVFTEEIYPLVIIVGYTANCLWNSSFVIMAVLALTRLGVNFFRLRANEWKWWMKVVIFVLGGYMFTVWLMGCVVSCFQLDSVNWSYNMTVPLSDFLSQQELYFCFIILAFSFSSYLIIIGSIYNQKRQIQSLSSMRTEIAILTQATVLAIYMGAVMILWHNAELWFQMTDITLALLNGSWLMFSHLNSSILIVTNRSIRQQFLTLLGGSRTKRSSMGNSVFVPKQATVVMF
ncbi:hypothetical protein CAEBREN_20684 [Caenorhabditis brenneri]|uniref:Uncharacterized protein n=1 Tax=Caenorhabditis brenneri TaxID=135651 RepID=G0MS45_CAEBE|nr:hypothetical protein CAEBREN_20684 [Caenorhabditis brenneri]